MADDGTFKGHGGKPGRKSTVISMSAHKNRHGGDDSRKKGPEHRVEGSGARSFQDNPPSGFVDQKALPCESSPFERDFDLQGAAAEPPAARGRGRRFLRWGLDESSSAGNDIFADQDHDAELGKELDLSADSDLDSQLEGVLARGRDRDLERNIELKKVDWDNKTQQSGSVFESFYHAINGLKAGFAGQRNVRIHCVISAMVFILALLLQVDSGGCLALILATGFVLFAEYVNTALEHITDIQAHFRHHQSARLAKDTAAGAVLIAAFTAVLVGLTVFAPRLYALLIGQT